jgi:cupin 2 domain-containing protein
VKRGNLFQTEPKVGVEERVEELCSGANVRVETIISLGQCSPEGFWYDQEEDEFVALLSGAALLEWQSGERTQLEPGDWIDIPAGVRHRVAWTHPSEPTAWLAVFRRPELSPLVAPAWSASSQST